MEVKVDEGKILFFFFLYMKNKRRKLKKASGNTFKLVKNEKEIKCERKKIGKHKF